MSYSFWNNGNFNQATFIGMYGDRSRQVAASMRQDLHNHLNGGMGSLSDAINKANLPEPISSTMHQKRMFMNSMVHAKPGTFGSSWMEK